MMFTSGDAMALEEYARKRSFKQTPEPEPETAGGGTGNRFCIQRHDATRLHYDFRLEIGGVLKSWAIPKGPSLNPADKRMAVQVEDHPLEYGSFEGNIPRGNYGAGSVMLWDRGAYEVLGDMPAGNQLARGDLKIRLHGEKVKGAFALVQMKGRGKGNEWLLIKKKDEFADPDWDIEAHAHSVLTGRSQEEIARELPAPDDSPPTRSSLPDHIDVMKACAAARPPAGEDWLFEIKWDGVRAICFIENGRVRLVSRNGAVMDRQYPELSVLPHQVEAESAILDGEIVALDAAGRPSFARLQSRITAADPNAIAHMARSHPVALYVFDLLYLDGKDLRSQPLIERKRLLRSVLKPTGTIRLSEHFTGNAGDLLEAVRENGLEGVVAKRARSRYESKRSPDWLKIKITNRQEFVICGYTSGEREHFSSLVLGVYRGRRLAFAGSVGTGFDNQLLKHIAGLLKPLVVSECPFAADPRIGRSVTWVRPELVCEVRFANWTEDGRLRAPVFLGLRPDADPRQTIDEAEQSDGPRPGTAPEPGEPLLPEDRKQFIATVEGRQLRFTNLGKVWFPQEGYTKRDLINYYDSVAEFINPYLMDRPLSLKRYPDGIGGEYFFQKNTPGGYPSWLRVEAIRSGHSRAAVRYIVGGDRATLLYLVNLGCIDHNPWMSRVGSLENPDFVLVDLDPQEAEFRLVVEAAQLVRRKLDQIGLEGYPKTTGGDGLHIYIPVEPIYTYDQTRAFAEVLARILAAERPDLFTTPRPVARREKGKVYFDYLQNSESKTVAAPYVVRAYPGAPVATPLEWRELTARLLPGDFTIRNAPGRFWRRGDLFRGVIERPQRLEPAIEKLEKLARA